MSTGGGPGRWLAIAASVLVAATLAAAVLSMGSPSQQRELRLDARRLQDLQQLERAVQAYYQGHQALPVDIATLAAQPGWNVSSKDPVDASAYAYTPTGERSYRLCARFTTDTATTAPAGVPFEPDQWNHAVGRHCFERKVLKPAE
ncbi:MAG: hypothetical protein ABIR05_02085 [Luteimonas sp.]